MPNQGNKSNGQSGIGREKRTSTVPPKHKGGTEENAGKNNTGGKGQKANTGNSAGRAGNTTSREND